MLTPSVYKHPKNTFDLRGNAPRTIFASIKILAAAAVIASFASCVSYYPRTDPNDEFIGLRERAAGTKVLRVFVVHGMKDHRLGYADDFGRTLAERLGYNSTHESRDDYPITGLETPIDYPTPSNLRVTRYHEENASRGLIVYEYLWSPLTRAIKNAGFRADDGTPKAVLNKMIKSGIMNDGLSEAALYVSHYRNDLLQRSAIKALGSFIKREYDGSLSSASEFEVMFVSHSLGSIMTYDALQTFFEPVALNVRKGSGGTGTIIRPAGSAVENTSTKALALSIDPTADRVSQTLRDTGIFVMWANQIPLLELENLDPVPNQSKPASRIQTFDLMVRSIKPEKIDLLVYSDPNDLLSYSLSEENVPRLKIHNIRPHNAWDFFGLFENPISAHGAYDRRDKNLDLLVDGLKVAPIRN